jgi:hypothetical protein
MSKRNKKAKSQSFKVPNLPQQLQHINLNAAGVDIGSERHMVAVPAGRDPVSVREFGSFTADLQDLVTWLKQCGVTTVAMESTGVYLDPVVRIARTSRVRSKAGRCAPR